MRSDNLLLVSQDAQSLVAPNVHADAAQGRFCARRPGLVLAGAAAAAALCALGLIALRVETDPQRLWVGAGSQAAREKADYEVARPCWAGTVFKK